MTYARRPGVGALPVICNCSRGPLDGKMADHHRSRADRAGCALAVAREARAGQPSWRFQGRAKRLYLLLSAHDQHRRFPRDQRAPLDFPALAGTVELDRDSGEPPPERDTELALLVAHLPLAAGPGVVAGSVGRAAAGSREQL